MSLHGPAYQVVVQPLGRSPSLRNGLRKPLYRTQSEIDEKGTVSFPKSCHHNKHDRIVESCKDSVYPSRTGDTTADFSPGLTLRDPAEKNVRSMDLLITELRKPQPDFDAVEHMLMFSCERQVYQLREELRCTERTDCAMNHLHKAAQAGSLITVTTILDARCSVNVESSLGRSALHYACDNDHQDIVKALLCRQANVNQKTPFGMTPLHIACYANAMGSVLLLLSQRKQLVEIEHEDERRRTPLMFARNELVRWMIRDYRESLGSRYSELVLLCRDNKRPTLTKREEREFGSDLVALAWSIIHESHFRPLPFQVHRKGLSRSLPMTIQLNCIFPFLGISLVSKKVK